MLDARATVAGGAPTTWPPASSAAASSAARFHRARRARDRAGRAREAAGARGLDTVVLSGGVFQNRLLLERDAAGC